MKTSSSPGQPSLEGRTTKIVSGFERAIILVLLAMLILMVSLSTVELVWLFVRDLSSGRVQLLDLDHMLELFGFFLLVLIGMELLTSLKSYLSERVIHVEVVLEVALVALAQKVIILDVSRSSGLKMIGLSGLILALTGALVGVRIKTRRLRKSRSKPPASPGT